MFQIAAYETFQDGQIIFEEGSSGDWIYEIDAGVVELSRSVGGQRVVVEVLHAGEVFGEMAFVAKIPRTATARAVGETTLGIMDRDYLDKELNKLTGSFRTLLKILVLRLKKATDNIVDAKINP